APVVVVVGRGTGEPDLPTRRPQVPADRSADDGHDVPGDDHVAADLARWQIEAWLWADPQVYVQAGIMHRHVVAPALVEDLSRPDALVRRALAQVSRRDARAENNVFDRLIRPPDSDDHGAVPFSPCQHREVAIHAAFRVGERKVVPLCPRGTG